MPVGSHLQGSCEMLASAQGGCSALCLPSEMMPEADGGGWIRAWFWDSLGCLLPLTTGNSQPAGVGCRSVPPAWHDVLGACMSTSLGVVAAGQVCGHEVAEESCGVLAGRGAATPVSGAERFQASPLGSRQDQEPVWALWHVRQLSQEGWHTPAPEHPREAAGEAGNPEASGQVPWLCWRWPAPAAVSWGSGGTSPRRLAQP